MHLLSCHFSVDIFSKYLVSSISVLLQGKCFGSCTHGRKLFFYVPCSFRMLAIMAFNNFPSFLAHSTFFFAVLPNPRSANHQHKLFKNAMHCFPLFLLQSVCLVSFKFSNPLLIIGQINDNFFPILSINNLCVSIFLQTSSHSHVQSTAFSATFGITTCLLLRVCEKFVQHLLLYKKTDIT